MEQFTRREAQRLTRSSSSRLTYLAKTGIVVPERSGTASRPVLLYSWEQILELRAINHLRRQISFQTIRKVVQFLDEHGFEPSLRDKLLIALDGEVSWVLPFHRSGPQVIQVVGKRHCPAGQLLLTTIPQLIGRVDGLSRLLKPAKVADFERWQALRSP